ncbi:MAG TPA: thioredoxin family protein [Acidimicrobiales bacterium]|nr:thioredoxin family protein [Acidimicrobiales bacterium]
MLRLVPAVVLAGAVAALAAWLQRRRPGAAPVVDRHHVPTAVDRSDFARPDAEWLVVVFTSATCDTCAAMWEVARQLASPAVATQEVEVKAEPALHERYGIDAVPTTVVCDREGAVVRSFLGPVSATHLWAAVAEAREPGSVPPGCSG